jgi:hypothetical protein
MRYRQVISCLIVLMAGPNTYAQSLFSPRAVAIAAYGPMVGDGRGFLSNPAGLSTVRDWELGSATYSDVSGGGLGFVFHGITVAKRITEHDAAAVEYSPGTALELVLPLKLIQLDVPVSIDTRMRYDEPFSFGYGYALSPEISVGFAGRLRRERLSDTQAQFNLDTTGVPLLVAQREYALNSWLFDVGALWRVGRHLTLSAVGRNLARVNDGGLPAEFEQFHLSTSGELMVGFALAAGAFCTAAEAGTEKTGALGCEWVPGERLAVRGGVYFSDAESPFAYAYGVGVGWSMSFVEADVSYLWFARRDRRDVTPQPDELPSGGFRSIDLNPYTLDRLSLSLKAILGNIRESLVRIEGVQIRGGVYPSSYEMLAYQPIGQVKVRNISGGPVSARASFYIDKYMDQPTETPPVYLGPEEERDIPITAVFNDLVRAVPALTVQEGTVYVSASPIEDYDDKYQTRVLIYGKNDWNGDVHALRYFVTPNDAEVIRYTRDVLLQQRDSIDAVPRELETFQKARLLFNSFAGKLAYVNDPKQSADYVQYPAETLQLRGGDCDDMTVCFSSLLNAIGVSTAFVEVVSPDSSTESHIYLLFDSGIEPRLGGSITSNPKRYLVRANSRGVETLWIPIETTVIMRGFDEAWTSGAQEYFDDVEVGLGLVKGWVRIVDVY